MAKWLTENSSLTHHWWIHPVPDIWAEPLPTGTASPQIPRAEGSHKTCILALGAVLYTGLPERLPSEKGLNNYTVVLDLTNTAHIRE